MTPKKYTLKEQEPKIEFVTRVVTSEDRPMTAQEVFDCIDLKSMPHATRQKIHANLSDASGTYQLIGKSRMMSNIGKKRVHYHPRGMVVSGEDIPVPAYSKTGGNTFVNEDKPDAVKVAEKVLADLGADDDDDGLRTLLTNEPIPTNESGYHRKRIAVDRGWVDMVDGRPKTFTLHTLATIAETMNWTVERTERVIIAHLRQVSVDGINKTLLHYLIQTLQQSYGRAPLNRME